MPTCDKCKGEFGWLRIETAPKDGTSVLVYMDVATVPVVHIAWYNGKKEWEESGQFCGTNETFEEWEGWWSYIEHSVTQHKLVGLKTPTHWMPLPEPPAMLAESQRQQEGNK